jgi:hypothetical protein
MNAELYINILRTHGEYVTKLTTEITTMLRALEDGVNNQQYNSDTISSHNEKISELHRLLATEADMFCRRLKGFIEQLSTLRTDDGGTRDNPPK